MADLYLIMIVIPQSPYPTVVAERGNDEFIIDWLYDRSSADANTPYQYYTTV